MGNTEADVQQAPVSRWSRFRWGAASLGLVLIVVGVVPASQIRMGERELNGLVGSYLYETSLAFSTDPVENLRIEDVFSPNTMRVKWDWHPTFYPLLTELEYRVERSLGGTLQNTGIVSTEQYDDTFSWTLGADYRYRVRVDYWQINNSLGLPPPPPGANSSDVHHVSYGLPSAWVNIAAIPQKTSTTDNQAVDSRYDLRYSTYTYVDHNFGTTSYRGGLFAGYAADGARVGRSFLKFAPSAVTTMGDSCWTGRMYGYYTRSVSSGSTDVGLQLVSNSWSGSTVTWSNAPSFTPASAAESVTVTHGTPGWVSWKMKADLAGLTFSSPVTFALASKSETSNGWAYFAKKEWDSTYTPYLLYVTGGPR